MAYYLSCILSYCVSNALRTLLLCIAVTFRVEGTVIVGYRWALACKDERLLGLNVRNPRIQHLENKL